MSPPVAKTKTNLKMMTHVYDKHDILGPENELIPTGLRIQHQGMSWRHLLL